MAQFDVYENTDKDTSFSIPWLLDIQADLLDNLKTRVVVPLLYLTAAGQPIGNLNPVFRIQGQSVVMSTPELAGIPSAVLGPRITSLKPYREEIIAALDFLLTGY